MEMSKSSFHPSQNQFTLWAHLPQNSDWSVNSYIKIYDIQYIEDVISIMNALPNALLENCMFFLMKKGITPTWEDKRNRDGGVFSYKVVCKNVGVCFRELAFALVGESLSKNTDFNNSVTGITISPKKNFCIVKIWMTSCDHQNAAVVTANVNGLMNYGCLFKKHSPDY